MWKTAEIEKYERYDEMRDMTRPLDCHNGYKKVWLGWRQTQE
jgi:hypothetical protein